MFRLPRLRPPAWLRWPARLRWRGPPPGPLLKHADQACAAVVIAAALGAMAVYWGVQQRRSGGLIEIDRAAPESVQFQVDINEADWPELTLLPDVGETLARRIVESRERDGPFLDHDDLRRVRGIGPKTLERMRPHLLPMPPAENVAGP